MNEPKSATDRPFTELESVDSTNRYALDAIHAGSARGGETYFAHDQFAGRGQRGRTWVAAAGENLAMSLVWAPANLQPDQQFVLSAAVANATAGWLTAVTHPLTGWRIKWPNDLYFNDRKASGMLIENILQGNRWRFAVIGLGLNLNPENFPPSLARAVSLRQITGQTYQPVVVARQLSAVILDNLAPSLADPEAVIQQFNERLYRRGEVVTFRREKETFAARIERVGGDGRLYTDQGAFLHGQVDWIG